MNVEQRARFEGWITKAYPDRDIESHENGRYAYAFASLAWEAWTAALTPPEGYVLVPVEPTSEMVKAGLNAPFCGHPETGGPSLTGMWAAMLAARPEVKP